MDARVQAQRTFGDWLGQRRRALDLTQEELAGQVGCSAVTLRLLEREERRPSTQIAKRLADVLQIPPEERPSFLELAGSDPLPTTPAAADSLVEPLTRRERDVLALLDEGFSAPEIAEKLTVAVSSVKTHIQHLYGKLGVNGKRPALIRARELGLLGGGATTVAATAAAGPAEPSDTPEPGESPFKGLRYFDEADATLFFGRRALVVRLVSRLADRPNPAQSKLPHFLAVVGASGSGKSSIVRAGVIPALRSTDGLALHFDPIHVITPTAHPLEALAASLTWKAESVTATTTLMDDLARDERTLHLYARRLLSASDSSPARPYRSNNRLLLVIDQFEELFTLCRGEAERQAFVNNLVQAAAPEADGPTTIVITLRADFYSACAPYPALRDMLAQQQEYIGPMSADELRQAIELPARLGRWEFAPGLVDLILRDVSDEPGALPLLSHALLETWRHRRGRTLTLKSYGEAGRVQGAIATTAEAVLQSMPPEEQALARSVFLRLTELGQGTQDTRRRVALSELLPTASVESPMARLLKTLSDARLITTDDAVVEVAHEALIREWPTLLQWLNEDRDGLRQHRHLTEAAQEWDELERDASELYRGPRLAQALEWAAPHSADLNLLERDFLEASQALAAQRAARDEAQRQQELEAARGLAEAQRQRAEAVTQRAAEQAQATIRLRARNRLISIIGALALLAAVAAGFFGLQAGRSAAVAQVANTQSAENLSVAQAASTQAIIQRDNAKKQANLAFANQLAAQAVAVMNSNISLALLLGAEGNRLANNFQTRDSLGRVFKYSPHLLTFLSGNADSITSVAFSPDGSQLAAGGQDGSLRLWDVASRQPAGGPFSLRFSFAATIAFSRDGKTLAVGGQDGLLHLVDAATGQPIGQPLAGHTASIAAVAFSPDGKILASASSDKTIRLWDAATGRPLGAPLTGHTDYVTSVAFSPDGKSLASSSLDRTLRLWDVASGQPLGEPFLGHQLAVNSVAFSPDGKTLASGSRDKDILLWDISDEAHTPLARLSGHTAAVTSVAFSPDGKKLVSASADRTLQIWDVVTHVPLGEPLRGHQAAVTSVAYSADGLHLASGSVDHTVVLWQVSDSLLDLASQDWPTRACAIAGRNLTHAEWVQFLAGQSYHKTCEQWIEGP